MNEAVRGQILWYELLTTDMKAAGDFYSKVVGWTIAPFEGAPQPYNMFMRSEHAPVAGVMNMGGQIGGAVVGILTPILAAQVGWSGSFLFTAGVCVVGALAWMFIDPYAALPADRSAQAGEAGKAASEHG